MKITSLCVKSMKKRPIDYFRNFYADTALFGGQAATKNGLDFFGVDHSVFASDVPFEPKPGLYIRETIRCIEGLDISAADKQKIYEGNARRLLKLTRRIYEATIIRSLVPCPPAYSSRELRGASCESLASLLCPVPPSPLPSPWRRVSLCRPAEPSAELPHPRWHSKICPRFAALPQP